jgi:hypothetical protein
MHTHHTHAANFTQGSHQMHSEWGHSVSKSLGDVRNHNSVGVKRPYLHELSIDHLHYGVVLTLPCIVHQRRTLSCAYMLSRAYTLSRTSCAYTFSRIPTLYCLSSRRTNPCLSTPLVHHIPCCTSVTRTAALLHVITYYCTCSPYPFCV